MKQTILVVISIFFFYTPFSGCGPGREEGFCLSETPQKYVLSGEDNFPLMPSVTLYENGNARLSAPAYSSFAFIGTGRYEIRGNEITVRHGENSVTFLASNSGKTLTCKSSDLYFTKAGAVYEYCSAGFSEGYKKVGGDTLTLAALLRLADKSRPPELADFNGFEYVEIDPQRRIFDVEGKYVLEVTCAGGETNCTVEQKSSGEIFSLAELCAALRML